MTDAPHIPVLRDETLSYLNPGPGKRFIDGTFGFGGHSSVMLETGAEVLQEMAKKADGLHCCRISFRHMEDALKQNNWEPVDGVLLDLGVSSWQLDDPAKGFSYRSDGPLDLRFNQDQGPTAADLVATLDEAELADLIWRWGEERGSRRIARVLVKARKEAPIETTTQFRNLIEGTLPRSVKSTPVLSRVFQALRIAVNEELEALPEALEQLSRVIKPGGSFVIISYHSLEDRLVKRFIDKEKRDCICPPELPVCRCEHKAKLKPLTRKAVKASASEETRNPRSRSARLRAAEIL